MKIFDYILTTLQAMAAGFLGDASPVGRLLIYGNNDRMPNGIPDVASLILLRRKQIIPKDSYTSLMRFYGYDEAWAEHIFTGSYEPLRINEWITLYRRGEIDYEGLVDMADKSGFTEGALKKLLKATEFFPSPGDLIRFAVREVYTPEVAEKFGMFEDLPAKFIEESGKTGLPQEQARNFWAAHWELPSPLQGFEMFHRRIINKDTLSLLLKSLDVMPFWRDKMIDLSHNPLTRVDVRRMYGLGVLDEIGVYNAYLDVGYSPENAELMTNFTVAYENSEYDGLTRSNILKAYKDHLIEKTELLEFLDGFGYSDTVIDFWVQQADFEKTEARIKVIEDDTIELYRAGAITAEEIRKRLEAEGLPAAFVERVVNDALLQEAKRRKLPSKEDLTDWLEKQIIDEKEYTTKMRIRGYRDDDIVNYLTEIAFDQNTEVRKYLKIATYDRWLTEGILTEKAYREITEGMGLSDEDIDRKITDALAKRQ